MKSTYKLKNSVFDTFSNSSSAFQSSNNSSFMASFVTKTLRWNKNYVLSFVDNHIIHYPTPINLTYAWSFGSSAGICLVIQILSGVFLAMHYTPHVDMAFASDIFFWQMFRCQLIVFGSLSGSIALQQRHHFMCIFLSQ